MWFRFRGRDNVRSIGDRPNFVFNIIYIMRSTEWGREEQTALVDTT